MQFLSHAECVAWCARRAFPTVQRASETTSRAASKPDGFHLAEFRHPADSGRKVWLSRYLYSLLDPAPELLAWIGEWSVARRQLLLPVGDNYFFLFLTSPSLGEAFDSELFSSFFSGLLMSCSSPSGARGVFSLGRGGVSVSVRRRASAVR